VTENVLLLVHRILGQCPGALIKQGIVSHGYQLNGELDLYQNWYALGLDKAYSRGELAVEPNPANGTYGNCIAIGGRVIQMCLITFH
jgi:hypothetical protein